MIEITLTLAIALALAWPLSKYMAQIFSVTPSKLERVFGPIKNLFYRLIDLTRTKLQA